MSSLMVRGPVERDGREKIFMLELTCGAEVCSIRSVFLCWIIPDCLDHPVFYSRAMIGIAITGGIACGKSVVGSLMAARGIPVQDADQIAHEVMARGTEVCTAIVKAFGPAVLDSQGEVDRQRLGAIVFADPGRLAHLNDLTHPEILRRLHKWLDDQVGRVPIAAGIVPLLYEARDEGVWSATVCVAAPGDEQRKRLEQRGLSVQQARARIGAQMPLVEKMERSDYVIYNCGSMSLLEEQVDRVVRKIRGE